MRNIGVIADPHSNMNALEAVLEDMPRVDRIICAGDLVGYGPDPNEVVDRLREEGVDAVMGNHDFAVANRKYGSLSETAADVARWTRRELEEDNLEFLKGLPETLRMEEGYDIFMVHGTPRKPLKEYIYPGVSNRVLAKMTKGVDDDLIVLGHTHVPLNQTIQGKVVLNPGAVGQPRDRDPKAGYIVLKLGREMEVIQNRVSYDIDGTEQKIKESGLPERFATRLHFGW